MSSVLQPGGASLGDYLRTRQWVQQHAPDARAFFIAHKALVFRFLGFID